MLSVSYYGEAVSLGLTSENWTPMMWSVMRGQLIELIEILGSRLQLEAR